MVQTEHDKTIWEHLYANLGSTTEILESLGQLRVLVLASAPLPLGQWCAWSVFFQTETHQAVFQRTVLLLLDHIPVILASSEVLMDCPEWFFLLNQQGPQPLGYHLFSHDDAPCRSGFVYHNWSGEHPWLHAWLPVLHWTPSHDIMVPVRQSYFERRHAKLLLTEAFLPMVADNVCFP